MSRFRYTVPIVGGLGEQEAAIMSLLRISITRQFHDPHITPQLDPRIRSHRDHEIPGRLSPLPQVRGESKEFESVVRGGVEPPTFRFSGGRSYQLSYLTLGRHQLKKPTGRS